MILACFTHCFRGHNYNKCQAIKNNKCQAIKHGIG